MNLLLLILLTPAIATGVLFCVPGRKVGAVRLVATLAATIVLVSALVLAMGYGDAAVGRVANAGTPSEHVYKHTMDVDWVPSLGLGFRLGVDGTSVAMVLLTAFIIFAAVIVSFSVEKRVKEYYINLMALVTGVFGVFVSLDLFFYYFFYELAVIPMFLLIGIWGSTTRTVDQQYATMKLVLMLSTGAVLALVGLLWLYTQGGTFDMVALEEVQLAVHDQMVWFPVVFLGFASLIPMWPLHSWSPAGHAAAPAAVSMLHAGVLMKLGAFGVLRVAMTYMPAAAAAYLPWVGLLCCFNIIYGALVAISHKDLKLIIGYSSSSHMGYVLLGLASVTMAGFSGAVFLMFAHGIMTALAFSLIGWFYDQTHTRMVGDLGGLMKVMPFAGFCFIVAAMASAGLPGFANFVSELLVIIGAWQSESLLTKIPAVLAVWGLVLTGVYLLRAVKDVWFGDLPERWKDLKDATTPLQKLPYVLLIGVLLYFGFRPQPMLDLVEGSVRPILVRIEAAADEGGHAATVGTTAPGATDPAHAATDPAHGGGAPGSHEGGR